MSMLDPTATQFGGIATGNPGLGPKDFSADGAVGAGGAGAIPDTQSTGGGADTQSTGGGYVGPTSTDAGVGFDPATSATNSAAYKRAAAGGAGGYMLDPSHVSGAENTYAQLHAMGKDDMIPADYRATTGFADGGAVGEDQNATPGQDDGGLQQSINQALETVDNALSYGRKLHGLPDGNGAIPSDPLEGNSTPAEYMKRMGPQSATMPTIPGNQSETPGPYKPGGGQKQAANMPAIPGGQSESGIPPLQPAPGRLPPTSNPFGKRADAGDSDGDEGQGAIPDNDQDEAA